MKDFHLRLMDGGFVVAAAILEPGDANRIDVVVEEMLIVSRADWTSRPALSAFRRFRRCAVNDERAIIAT